MTIATAVMAVTPFLAWIYKVVIDKIATNKAATDKKIDQMDAELRASHRREDAVREVSRIDRDISNLRDDVSKGFDRLYDTLSESKKELLDAIRESRK